MHIYAVCRWCGHLQIKRSLYNEFNFLIKLSIIYIVTQSSYKLKRIKFKAFRGYVSGNSLRIKKKTLYRNQQTVQLETLMNFRHFLLLINGKQF
jgi:hypothetical protein